MKNLFFILSLLVLTIACNNSPNNTSNPSKEQSEIDPKQKEVKETIVSNLGGERKNLVDKFQDVDNLETLLTLKKGTESPNLNLDSLAWEPYERETIEGPLTPITSIHAIGKTSLGNYYILMVHFSTPSARGTNLFAIDKKMGKVKGGLEYSSESTTPSEELFKIEVKAEGLKFLQTKTTSNKDGKVNNKTETTFEFDQTRGEFVQVN